MKKSATTKPAPSPSPGRANKYPPPLMRFLRSNVGSRSRGRSSRASSLFLRRKRTTSIEAHQEPSSPKVTCIGQVRVHRSDSEPKPNLKKGSRRRRTNPVNTRSCYSFHFEVLCLHRKMPCCFRRHWRKLVSFFRTDSSKKGERFGRVIGSGGPIDPPKNAFLMTRCSSAPHKNRFRGLELKTGEQENRGGTVGEEEEEEVGPIEIPRDSEVVDSVENCRGDAEEEEEEEEEEEKEKVVEGEKQSEAERSSGEGPVMLTRSKSEPASMWRERSFESTLSSSSSTHSVDNK